MVTARRQLDGRFPIDAHRSSSWRLAATATVILLSVAACAGAPQRSAAPTAPAESFPLVPGREAVGMVEHYVVRPGDVFPDIARRFDLGYTELVTANPGVDPWLPPAGRTIMIPSLHVLPKASHRGIVINLAQWRLFYFPPGGGRVETYPIGLGVIGRRTPMGVTRVVRKEPHPTWYVPASIRAERPGLPAVVKPGPDNPLGDYALHLGWPGYLIHGTNKPDGVGRNVSHGCVHLYPEDIARLFREVSIGTPVRTIDQPATAGWQGDRLYVEVYPSKAQTQAIDTDSRVRADPAHGVAAVVTAAAGRDAGSVDWRAVAEAAKQRTGAPVVVAQRTTAAAVVGSGSQTAEPAPADRPRSPGL
jgi:L,D-transpeptidase ErfK/SrfK